MNAPRIDRIIHSKRRTFSIEIERDGSLTVRAPKRASMRSIREIVDRKRAWIERKQQQVRGGCARTYPREFKAGEEFLYLGHPFKLQVDGDSYSPLSFSNRNFILSTHHKERARELFTAWYREQARSVISESAEHYSTISGIRYDRVKITNARKRWGSCSTKGNLCFSWRLIMAPLEVIDYVVVHELAHIEHKDHSRKFWGKVESILPDYRKRRQWLKENDYQLTL
jgi:predicted metal-dependent hydrolase